jgi:hypothetical protein
MSTSTTYRVNSTLTLSLDASGNLLLTWTSPKTGELRTDTCPRIEVVEGPQKVNVRGGQHFGSGGYYCFSLFSKAPTEVGSVTSSSDSFISTSTGLLDMPGGGLAWLEEGDCAGEGRDWSRLLVWKGGPEEDLLSRLRTEQARLARHKEARKEGARAGYCFRAGEFWYDRSHADLEERARIRAWHDGAPARAAEREAELAREARLLAWEQERRERAHLLIPPPKGLRDKRPVPQV